MSKSFLQKLSNLLAEKVLSLDEIHKPLLGFQPFRPLRLDEKYISDCFQSIAEIESLLSQLEYSAVFVSSFRKTPAIIKHNISRYDYILYHIEVYLLKVTGIMDRLLIAVNVILQLNLDVMQCKAGLMLKSQKGNKGVHANRIETLAPGLSNDLIKLLDYINLFRDDRNIIAHSERISYEDLRQIEMYHVVIQNSDEEKFIKMKPLLKQMTDKKALEYKRVFKL
jgi:hypothetical protein